MTQHEPQVAAASSGERQRARTDFQSSMSGLDHSSVMGVELLGAILVWTGIGWQLDRWLGTAPVLMIVGALIGNFAGLYLIWLRSQRMDDAERLAATERRRPRVVASPGAAVVDAVVAGRTGVPTFVHTHGLPLDGARTPGAPSSGASTPARPTPGPPTAGAATDDGSARGGRVLER